MLLTIITNSLLVTAAYLIGSLSSAILICKAMRLPDPRTTGSKNPGATNILRIAGKNAAALTLLADVLKGTIPILVARLFTADIWVLQLVAIAAFLGHLFPCFFQFKGGKGVATAFGVLLALTWKLALLIAVIWLVVAFLFRYSSLAALSAAVSTPSLAYALSPIYVWGILFISICLVWRHKANIHRLLQGTESKLKLG